MRTKLGIASMLTLTTLCCSGWTAPQQCADAQPAPPVSTGPSAGEVIGITAAIGAAITTTAIVATHEHKSHNITGCITASDSGLTLVDDDRYRFVLSNAPADLKPGYRVSLHGKKAADMKDSPAGRPFAIQHLNKEYGTCKVTSAKP